MAQYYQEQGTMKDKAKKIIRNLLVGAIASIYNTNVQAETTTHPMLNSLNGEDKKDAVRALGNKIYRNVLQITSKGDMKLIAGHRSHMSHRSGGGGGGGHYSHASHYSSYGGSRSHSSHSSHSSSSYVPYRRTVTPPKPKKTYKNYDVGDRTISPGIYGNDVRQVTNLLVEKNYLRTGWLTYKNGYPVYDTRVVSAIKRFQKDAGLTQDGKISSTLLSSLQSWDESNTTILLGIRTLAYNADFPVSGADVTELITLLNKAGFPPNPKKLKYSGGKAVFTKDIETAVRLFQAYNGLTVNGNVDESTLIKLRSK